MTKTWIYHLQEIQWIAGELLRSTKKKIWLLEGTVGMGKTTLIKALCKKLGVKEVVCSPSFMTVNEYSSKENTYIYHFDFYHSAVKMDTKDFACYEEYFYSNDYCFVEWPGTFVSYFSQEAVQIKISALHDQKRILELKGY